MTSSAEQVTIGLRPPQHKQHSITPMGRKISMKDLEAKFQRECDDLLVSIELNDPNQIDSKGTLRAANDQMSRA